jgi:hypothetical protein
MQLRGTVSDEHLRELRAGVIEPTSVTDFFFLSYFSRDRYKATNSATVSVVKRRQERDKTGEILRDQFVVSPYQEQPLEVVEVAVEDLKNRGYQEFATEDEKNLYFKANNQITYLKGQLTLSAKAARKLNHVQSEHIPGYRFRTRREMEEVVFGKDFIKGETDVQLRREKVRLKRELAAYKRVAALFDQAQKQHNASVQVAQEPILTSVVPVEETTPVVEPHGSSKLIQSPSPKESNQTRRDVLSVAGVGGAWTVLAIAAQGFPEWIRKNGSRIAKEFVATNEYGVFAESTQVVNAIGEALISQFPAPNEFPKQGEQVVLQKTELHRPMPQTVAEVIATGRPIVVEGLKQLFLSGRFVPNKDIYWNIEANPLFEKWADQLIVQLADKSEGSERVDGLNARVHQVKQSVIEPVDVAEEILMRVVGKKGNNELCRLCDVSEQQDRLALVSARIWYEKLYKQSRSHPNVNFSPVMDRLAPYVSPEFSLQPGQQVGEVVFDFLKTNLGEQWKDNVFIRQFATRLGEGALGMVSINGMKPEELDMQKLPVGSTITFDPRLLSFVEMGLEEHKKGTLSLATLLNRFDIRQVPVDISVVGPSAEQKVPVPHMAVVGRATSTGARM